MATLEEIEGDRWGEPAADATELVRRCHELRRKRIEDFTVGDLRIMIGQNIGLDPLVATALDVVEHDPMVSGDYFNGDLLVTLFRVPENYWAEHTDLWLRLLQVAEELVSLAQAADKFLNSSRGGA